MSNDPLITDPVAWSWLGLMWGIVLMWLSIRVGEDAVLKQKGMLHKLLCWLMFGTGLILMGQSACTLLPGRA